MRYTCLFAEESFIMFHHPEVNLITICSLQVQEDLGGAVRGASAGPDEESALVSDQHVSGSGRPAARRRRPARCSSGSDEPKKHGNTQPGSVW